MEFSSFPKIKYEKKTRLSYDYYFPLQYMLYRDNIPRNPGKLGPVFLPIA